MTAFFQRAGQGLARLSLILSALCLVALMGLTVLEVIGRYAFNAPIFGRQDIAQILLALSIFLALPVVTLRGEQIDVDLLDPLFSSKAAFFRDVVISLSMAGILLTMGYWLFLRAEKFLSRGITSELLFLPKYPLIYFIAVSVSFTGVALLILTVMRLAKARGQ